MNTAHFKAFWFAMNATFHALGQEGSLDNIKKVMATLQAVAQGELTLVGSDAEIQQSGVPATAQQMADLRAEQTVIAIQVVEVVKAMFGNDLFQ